MKLRIPVFVVVAVLIVRASAAELSSAEIYRAIRNNDLQVLRSLSSEKNVEVADERGRTPLMHAAGIGSLEAVKVLLARGADANAADSFGVTPLMFGIRDIAKVRLLVDSGANVNHKSKQDQTALLIAAAIPGSIETLRFLAARGADAKAAGGGGRTGPFVAAGTNDLKMVQFFTDQGLNVNSAATTDFAGHTALMAAAAQSSTSIVKALIEKGADVNMAATDVSIVKNGPLALKGRTALMMAVPYGSQELIRMLLDARANVNARDVNGLTPLMFAVASENQDPEVVKMLLAADADVNARTMDGETSVDWARKYGNPATLKLLDRGIPPTATPRPPSSLTGRSEPSAIPPVAELRSMIQASAALLQRSSTVVAANGGCVNCHHQILTGVSVAAAREKAIPVDEVAAAEQWKAMLVGLRGRENAEVQRIVCCGGLDSTLYAVSALQANKYPADAITDSVVVFLMSLQFTDGRWSREFASRSPLQDGDINRVALAVSALQSYAPPTLRAEVSEHVARARRWLMSAQPKTTDDRAILLIGLRSAGAPQSSIQAAAKSLLDLQGIDGGWAGNRNLESDAYATGEALSALFAAGVLNPQDAAYRRGIQFLLGTRAKDGSWHVRSRATKFQPYFESGFPYGHDQWISIAATARAVVALSRYLQ